MTKVVCIGYALVIQLMVTGWVMATEPRNLLSSGYSRTDLRKALITDHSWIPYPAYSDRNAWSKVPAGVRQANIALGERYLDYAWPQVTATLYLDFVRTGNLEKVKNTFNEKKRAFENLVMAELMEGEGRFLDDIINGVWNLCEMTYWGPPSHLGMQKAGPGLPDVDEPTVGIATGATATDLAWAYYFFNEEFDKVSPLINKRIKREIYRQVLEPYYASDDIHWLGFTPGRRVNNWNVWCNYYVLNCILLLEEDPEVKRDMVYKVMRSVDNFINAYHDDGGCDEGPAYWNNAGGKLFDTLELLHKVTNGHIDIFHEEIVRNIGRYIYKVYINDRYFVNFADAHNRISPRAAMIYRYGRRIEDPLMKGFGAFLSRQQHPDTSAVKGETGSALEDLFVLEDMMKATPVEPLIGSYWMPGIQIAGARDKAGSRTGFYFAAKGGHNRESHNHNDIGHFILYYNGEPAIVDVGVGTYTSKTFGSKRYEIWTMQSGYHNVPLVNGQQQSPGRAFEARAVRFSDMRDSVRFSADIAKAYGQEAGIRHWERTYVLNRGERFTVTDDYDLAWVKDTTRLTFLSACEVAKVSPGEARLKGKDFELQMRWDATQYTFTSEPVVLDDPKLEKAWPGGLTRILLVRVDRILKGSSRVVFTPR